jgi:hypothetical protein
MKAAHRPHILVSESPLKEGQDYTAPCKAEIKKAHFVRTDGDLRMVEDWLNALNRTCRVCKEKFYSENKDLDEVHVYFAVDGQLASLYQKTDVPEIQRLID